MITAVTGLNGAGKTAYAVGMLEVYRKRGIRTAANIGVDGAEYVQTFDQLLGLRDCVLLVDEVTAVASSRQFASLSPEALLYFQTLRHSNVGLIYTAPTIDRCDIALRSLTLNWTHLSPLITRRSKGGIWRSTLVSLVRSGSPGESSDGTPKMVAPWFSLYRPARHWARYDSFADVDLFTRVQRFPSRCPGCGASVDYSRVRAQQEIPVLENQFQPVFYCPRCGHSLGSPPRSQLVDDIHTDQTNLRTEPAAGALSHSNTPSQNDIPEPGSTQPLQTALEA